MGQTGIVIPATLPTVADTTRRPSPNIWTGKYRCPFEQIMIGTRLGAWVWDDFHAPPEVATNATVPWGNWQCFTGNDAANLITGYSASAGAGVLADMRGEAILAAGAADNISTVMQYGDGASFIISDTAGDDKRLWFETRVRITDVDDGDGGAFVGLALAGRDVTAGLFADVNGAAINDILADVGMIGFHFPDADGDSVDFVYGEASQTAVTLIDGLSALTSATFLKLGFLYDPSGDSSHKIRVFVNGVESTTFGTAAIIAAAAFPDATPMTVTAGVTSSGGARSLGIDWIKCVQDHES